MEAGARHDPIREMSAAPVEYRVLGPLHAVRDGTDRPLGGPRQQMVLAVLLANADRVVSQDELIDAVWSGHPPDAATSTLHGYVSVLRKELGGEIVRHGRGYRVEVDADRLDAARFTREVSVGRAVLDREPQRALDVLDHALSSWYGHPYGDLGEAPALAVEVVRLEELRLTAVEARLQADLAVGNHASAVAELDALIREYPYRERLRALQMLALYRSGRQSEALRAYERARVLLADELGIDPSPELRRLEQQILEQDPDLDREVDTGSEAWKPPTHHHVQTDRGRSVGGYELRDKVGAGARGEVYRAYQPSMGRVVAIKVIRPDLVNRPEFVRRFEATAQIIAQLEHPHIVGLIDYWRDPNGAFLVMPFMRGGNLTEALRPGPWKLAPALELLDGVGRALAYAHRRGVVHGRVEPDNVLLDEEGNAYLTDFGLGDAGPGSARAPGYGPPEPAGAAPPVPTPASDVFGLGVLAFHLLTGIEPTMRPPAVLSDACAELPSELSDVIARATDPSGDQRFDKVDDFLRALRRAVGTDVVAIAQPTDPVRGPPSALRNPYKGLRSFTEIDACDFYGRSALTDEVLTALRSQSLVAVVGPSGSGKSSVVRAGVVPALRAEDVGGSAAWLITDMFPGSFPFEELEAALLRVAVTKPRGLVDELTADERGLLRVIKQILPRDDSHLVLVIDQFEELFSALASQRTGQLFLDSLAAVADDERGRVKVLITMRADFFDRPLEHERFGRLMRAGLVTAGPPSRDGLAQAIAGPARAVGLDLEPGLVGEVIHDVDQQPGALPLLQYALTELFDRRTGDVLTIEGYRATGGVKGALGRRAEELFGELSARDQDVARQLFLRLVTVDDLAADTRRRVRLTELRGLAVEQRTLDAVLGRYGSFRLLSYDRDPVARTPTVEVAHEALLKEWHRLAGWVDAERENLLVQRRIGAATREWVGSGRDESFLLGGGRLEQAERWAGTERIALSSDEADYLCASRAARDADARATARRRRRVVALLAVGLLVALSGGVFAVIQRNEARHAETLQLAQRLGAQALIEDNLELSLLLARQAVAIADEPETRGDLLSVLLREPRAVGIMHGSSPDSILREVAVSRDGGTVAVVDQNEGAVLMFDTATFDPIGDPIRTPGLVEALAYSPSGDTLAIGGGGHLRLVDTDTRRPVAAVALGSERRPVAATQVMFTGDGSQLISVETEGGDSVGPAWISIRDATTLEPVDEALRPQDFEGNWLSQQRAVPPVLLGDHDRSLIVAATERPEIGWWDIATGERTRSIVLEATPAGYRALAISPDGATIAAGLARGFALIDVETGEVRTAEGPGAAFPIGLLFSHDGRTIVSTGLDGAVTLWATDRATEIERLEGHSRAVWHPAFSPDGETLYTPSYDGTAIAWDIGGSHQPVRGTFRFTDDVGFRHWPYVHPGRFSPDGERIAVGLEGRGIGIRDATDLTETATLLDTGGEVRSLAFTPDGETLIAVSDRGDTSIATVWDVGSGTRRSPPMDAGGASVLGISADGSRFVIGNRQGGVELRDVGTAALLGRFGEHGAPEAAELVSGGQLLLVYPPKRVEIWDVDRHFLASSFDIDPIYSPAGLAVAAVSDGTMLAIAGLDPVVQVWDATTGELVRSFEHGVGTAVRGIDFHPDGTLLAVSGGDGFASLWDVETGLRIGPRLEAGGREALVDVAPDGRSLLMTLGNGEGAVWDIDPDSWTQLACALAHRQLTPDEWSDYLPDRAYEPACEPLDSG